MAEDDVESDDGSEEDTLPAHWQANVHVLRDIIEKHASEEAKMRQWDSDEALNKLLMDTAKWCPDFVSELFSSVCRENVPEKVKGHFYKDDTFSPRYYSRWTHRSVQDVDTDIAQLQVDASGLREAVAQYLKNPKWRSEYIDWYIAEVLTYSEYYRFVEHVQDMFRGPFAMTMIRGTGGQKFFGYVWVLVRFLLKWAIWLVAIFFASDAWEGAGVLAVVVATVAWQVYKWRGRRKSVELVNAMRGVYEIFATGTFSWEVAWGVLNSSREKGAVWPGELYRLVELRKAEQ